MKKNLIVLFILLLTSTFVWSESIDSTVWTLLKNKKTPISLSYNLPDDWQNPSLECGLGNVGTNWTFPLIAGMKLTAFKEELYTYCNNIEPSHDGDMDWGLRLFAAYGAGFRGNWDEHWCPGSDNHVVYIQIMKQLKNSGVRKALWTFLEPALKHQIKTMQLKFQGILILSYEYVADYFQNYDINKAMEWYDKDSDTHEFAYIDYKGNSHPSRKITALVERLMFKWGVIDYKTISYWSAFIGNWLKKTLGQNYSKAKAYWGK